MTSEARQAQAAGYIEWAKKMYPGHETHALLAGLHTAHV